MSDKYAPMLILSEDDLPDIADWQVGGKYDVCMTIEEVSQSKGDSIPGGDDNDKGKVRCTFRVKSVSVDDDDDDSSDEDDSDVSDKLDKMKEKADNSS